MTVPAEAFSVSWSQYKSQTGPKCFSWEVLQTTRKCVVYFIRDDLQTHKHENEHSNLHCGTEGTRLCAPHIIDVNIPIEESNGEQVGRQFGEGNNSNGASEGKDSLREVDILNVPDADVPFSGTRVIVASVRGGEEVLREFVTIRISIMTGKGYN